MFHEVHTCGTMAFVHRTVISVSKNFEHRVVLQDK
jgi:hypothetical protein